MTAPPDPERRREPRVDLRLLVRVEGFESDRTSWTEVTTTQNTSAGGVSFGLQRRLLVGQVLKLHLTLPFPQQAPQVEGQPPSYGAYAVVRDVQLDNGGARVGAMFVGDRLPEGFDGNPAALYLFPCDVSPEDWRDLVRPSGTVLPPDSPVGSPPRDRRESPRFEISAHFLVQHVDEWEGILEEGLTVAENLSRGGAMLLTTAALSQGDIVILREIGGGFVTRAEVTGFDFDEDRARHVRVKFLGASGPDHLLPNGT